MKWADRSKYRNRRTLVVGSLLILAAIEAMGHNMETMQLRHWERNGSQTSVWVLPVEQWEFKPFQRGTLTGSYVFFRVWQGYGTL